MENVAIFNHFTCCVSYQVQQLLLNASNSLIVRIIPNKCFAFVSQAEASNFQSAFTAGHALCVEFGRQRRSLCFRLCFCFPLPSFTDFLGFTRLFAAVAFIEVARRGLAPQGCGGCFANEMHQIYGALWRSRPIEPR